MQQAPEDSVAFDDVLSKGVGMHMEGGGGAVA